MRILRLGVQNYRNIKLSRLELDAGRVFFVGRNGQGKTNLLESIGCITALRAFRTRENKTLIGLEEAYSEIAYTVAHEEYDEVDARIRIKPRGKEAWIDGQPAKRVSDFVSRFPTVVLSSGDMEIAQGSPSIRRRLLDNFLCGASREYFIALQRYQKALHERNALLKKGSDPGVLKAFERQLAAPASFIYRQRKQAVVELLERATDFYQHISGKNESLEIDYKPSLKVEAEEDFLESLERNRKRDEILQSTSKGPHRDDFEIRLNGMAAADFASEGQQRSTVLALSLGIIRYWRETLSVSPVVLADDVLGELDTDRRMRFWEALDSDLQFIATGTRMPEDCEGHEWKVFRVEEGEFTEV